MSVPGYLCQCFPYFLEEGNRARQLAACLTRLNPPAANVLLLVFLSDVKQTARETTNSARAQPSFITSTSLTDPGSAKAWHRRCLTFSFLFRISSIGIIRTTKILFPSLLFHVLSYTPRDAVQSSTLLRSCPYLASTPSAGNDMLVLFRRRGVLARFPSVGWYGDPLTRAGSRTRLTSSTVHSVGLTREATYGTWTLMPL